ncbi:MAG: lipoprotein signal peptidase [Bacteroidales bacterium]|nr:lipoprotein signal peptidase [Bacteroidales bacterium]
MSRQKKFRLIAIAIVVVVLLVDQILKFWVKTHMTIGQLTPVLGNWFNLLFIENTGMAFGLSFGQNIGKLLLSLVRIVLVVFLCWYLHRQISRDKLDGLTLTVFCLVIAGALGNILDSLFYGLIFSESTPETLAVLFPEGGGYAPFFFGRVVDMFYVRLFHIPDGFPLWGGSYFFPAIFNFADACITVGIFLMLIFNKRFFQHPAKENSTGATEEAQS